jgi:hypothetical protein
MANHKKANVDFTAFKVALLPDIIPRSFIIFIQLPVHRGRAAYNRSVYNMSADGTRLKGSFSILLYIFNQGDGNSIAATS